jgi:hypothetical protein
LAINDCVQVYATKRSVYIVSFSWCSVVVTASPEARVRFPALPKKIVGLERGPLSLVSTTEALLDRKVENYGTPTATFEKHTDQLKGHAFA